MARTPRQGPGGGGIGFLAVLAMAASQMGPAGPTVGLGWTRVGPSGSAQEGRFCFFFEFIFNAKTIPEKSRNCLKARKILEKSKLPEAHWDMNNPNKVFGGHEKEFRAF
jgi:hypothetical protein